MNNDSVNQGIKIFTEWLKKMGPRQPINQRIEQKPGENNVLVTQNAIAPQMEFLLTPEFRFTRIQVLQKSLWVLYMEYLTTLFY